ncbi:hypothetical protein DOY81_007486 [Sarcophaga bullata]|nr:hypothetical protein DOY81_007486 [Sarcophaga bullata]
MDNGIIGLAGFGLIFNDSTTKRIRLSVFLANIEDFIFHDVRRPFAFEVGADVIREFSKPVVSIITQDFLLYTNFFYPKNYVLQIR